MSPTRGDPEAYAEPARPGLTLEEIGRRVGRSREHARLVLARGRYRTRALVPVVIKRSTVSPSTTRKTV